MEDLRHFRPGDIIKMRHKHTGRVVYAQVTSIFSAWVGRANRITLKGNEAYLGQSTRIDATDGWCRVRDEFPVLRARSELIQKNSARNVTELTHVVNLAMRPTKKCQGCLKSMPVSDPHGRCAQCRDQRRRRKR